MTIQRRRFLKLAGAAAASLSSARAFALDYPVKSVRWVVSTAAGGAADIVSRLTSSWLAERFGQSFVVDNRPGAGVNIATDAVLKAPADGYTLFILHKGNVTAASLYDKLEYDFLRDIEPVASISSGPLLMLVNAAVPAKTVPEFIAYAKANPDKINMASVGNGSDPHLAGELFNMMAGIKMAHVPFRGGALAMTDLLGGNVQVFFSSLPAMDYVKAGTLRALAVTTGTRLPELPDIPAIAEFVPGYESAAWFGVGARKGTPADIVDKLNREIGVALTDSKIKDGLKVLTSLPVAMTPAEFGKFLAAETDKWAKVIKTANIKGQ